ncbi:T9SS type A sorting domain-containing protein [Flavobacterium sp.]|uniref:T9SS type A sorting domain-containing protein n=1 Tax=Flavobacterium sp. TaxID=239 RepID=UPI002FDA7B93
MIKKYVILLTFSILNMFLLNAQQLQLDPTYGVNGINTANVDLTVTYKYPDNKIIAVTKPTVSYPSLLPTIKIYKYTENGTIDTSFGTNGIANYTATSFRDRFDMYGVTVQPDGKILTYGQTYQVGSTTYLYNFFICRFNENGTTDTSFGTNGIIKYSLNTFNQKKERFLDAVVDENNKIIAVGYTETDGFLDSNAVAMRFLPDGTVDTSFGTDGVFQFAPNTYDYFNKIYLVEPSTYIIVGGTNVTTTDRDVYVLKITENGTFHENFGTNGTLTLNFSAGLDYLYKIFFQPDQSMLAVGTSVGSVAFAKIHANGTLDTHFSGDGMNTTYVPVPNHYPLTGEHIELLPDGKFILASTCKRNDDSTNNYDYGIARLNANTTLDTSFMNNGVFVDVVTGTNEYARGIYVQQDGKVIVLVNGRIYRYVNFSTLNIAEVNASTDIYLHPNPAKDNFTIISKEAIQDIEIYSNDGKLIQRNVNVSDNTIAISHLKSGLYFVKIKNYKSIKTLKLIKH